MNTNKKDIIISALEKMRKKEIAEKQPFKARAYANVIKQLESFDKPITKFADLEGVTGIGESIKHKIIEILETGHLEAVEAYDADPKNIFFEQLLRIHAIGPAKAKELVDKYNISTLEQLENNKHLLNEKQLIGLKYFGEFDIRIPRIEMDKHNQFINDTIKHIDPLYKVELAGSYRRGEKDSGDIDVLITHPDDSLDHEKGFKQIIDEFMKKKYVTDIFALGGKKCLAVCKANRHKHFRRIDFMFTHKNEFPFALAYFTGNQAFNIDMRNLALEHGYSLSEYGFKYTQGEHKGEFVDAVFETENDIFDYINLVYVTPKDRKAGILQYK